jgi:ADP-heptose:LPS heptosyltransferase
LTQQTITLGLIRTSSIGDVVLSTAVLNFLERLSTPERRFKVYFFSKKPCLDLLECCAPGVEILDIEGEEIRLQEPRFMKSLQLLIDLQDNPRSKILSRQFMKWGTIHVKTEKFRWQRSISVLKGRWYGRGRVLTPSDLEPLCLQYQAALEAVCRGLALLGIDVTALEVASAKKAAHPTLKTVDLPIFDLPPEEGPWIALGPGASFETKKYPELDFKQVLEKLQERLPKDKLPHLVFLGDKNDRDFSEKIISALNWPKTILNLCGKTTLPETTQILSQAQLILCGDTSLAHIGEAVGTPSGVIFGPTIEAFGFKPFRKESRAFSSTLGCRPCSKHGSTPCRFGDKACFTSIEKDLIVDWICQTLDFRRQKISPPPGDQRH